jgi:TonB family protein
VLDILVASRPVSWKARYTGIGTLSVLAHGSIILALAVATVKARPLVLPAPDTMLVFISEVRQDAVDEEEARAQHDVQQQLILAGAPLRGFQTIAALSEIPTAIPPADLGTHFDPRDYSGVGVEGGVADGLVVDPAIVSEAVVYVASVADDPPEVLMVPQLQYPELLRQAGVEGSAMLEFIVDREGAVEAATIRLVECTHAGFAAAAIAVAQGARFRPARVGGRAVRVLVRMPVNFTLTRRGA